jgi:hypothetical protein
MFEVFAPVADVFPLFSPDGERLWVPEWKPDMLHPPGAVWEEEMLFRTREESGDAIWVLTRLDPAAWRVVYHRVEPERYVARIEVRCTSVATRRTIVHTAYRFVGLSGRGNADIAAMTVSSYDAKMDRWAAWIAAHLAGPPRPSAE